MWSVIYGHAGQSEGQSHMWTDSVAENKVQPDVWCHQRSALVNRDPMVYLQDCITREIELTILVLSATRQLLLRR